MYQNGANRAFARGLLVLVSPAAIVGECRPFEKISVVRWRLVHQHQQNFAAHVHALVVVPLIFGCLDSVADVNDLCVNIVGGLLSFVVRDILVERLKPKRFAFIGNDLK